MKLEEFKSITAKIVQNLSNQALVTELLTQLNDDYSQESTSKDTLTKQLGEYEGKVKTLQETNMQLFLRTAQPIPDTKIGDPNPENKLTYEALLENWDK
jgi:hypothetical protein